MSYDSTLSTMEHQKAVCYLIIDMMQRLSRRAIEHDSSKLWPEEKDVFDEYTPKLKDCTYESEEYKGHLKGMGEALKHHYKVNSHHPEHFEDGIKGMNLIDVVEMLCDWVAASERHADGDPVKSVEKNQERFGFSDDLKAIFMNTVRLLH